MDVYLNKTGPEDATILKNMYALYLHDLSAYSNSLEETPDGTYEFDSFSVFWSKQGVNPYFIMVGEERAGFLLLLEPPFTKNINYVVNDFFLYNRFRGKGVAAKAVEQLFEQKKGSYFVGQLSGNDRAIAFWRKAYIQNGIHYEEYEDEEEGESIICQEFTV
ncbi:GNAT family N-acetyltransferase [Neobacillus notoginsengisoli]|uniref:GNAT family N-acetyltransferase n=1 Tax=Neobacillus notoginsengisoli TaxID=1578198 RepID=A0A417YT96_9BACI|nr:GNAT family N-acetyltransferase [Neobacillus notoginsengisoli]RHW40272.1 GNAT family N-acetyltransferase [Neobacillus notoginsengisoli]